MQSLRPRAELRDRVVSIELVETAGGPVRILPGTSAVLGFQARGRVRRDGELLSAAGVTGIQGAARAYDYVGPTITVLVRFTPQGAACLGVPASELSDRSIPLDAILPRTPTRQALDRLAEARGAQEQVTAIESFLVGLPYEPDPLIDRAIALLGQDADYARISGVARTLALSERQLERRFLKRVGITPKRFARLSRFERAVALARKTSSLAAAALDAGYYDQAHFNRDFRDFAGGAPSDVLRTVR